jgi:para-aminobenzoate synthetase component 1
MRKVAYFENDKLLFFGSKSHLLVSNPINWLEIDSFLKRNSENHIVTLVGYDCKNSIELLETKFDNQLYYPDLIAWVPEFVVKIRGEEFDFLSGTPSQEDFNFCDDFIKKFQKKESLTPIEPQQFIPKISKEQYISQVDKVLEEIQYGNCYELNFCQEFHTDILNEFDLFNVFCHQFQLTKAPFSVYFKFDQFEIACASPERYIKKIVDKLISEPIKGTIKRGSTESEDDVNKTTLLSDPKERSENIMITDLVRNDLSRIAVKGSVKVESLCEIQTFETVHHMVSRIACSITDEITFVDCIRSTFPMGSMTGAPKVKVMELTDKLEGFKRGIYSGSLGVIYPGGDFDLNVVIRSFVYNSENGRLSCSVGGAITNKSIPEKEYEECLTKVKKIIQLFGEQRHF